jgi:ligand-binding SRPBCC domain-containing protein
MALVRFTFVIRTLHRHQFVAGLPTAVWDFFATPRNLDALTPPSMRFDIIGRVPSRMYPGQMIQYRVGLLPGVKTTWLTEITHVREGEFFVDEQRLGPYKLWHHEHRFTPAPERGGVTMSDTITYDPGWGWLGAIVDAVWIRRQIATIFDYRAQKIAELFPSSE